MLNTFFQITTILSIVQGVKADSDGFMYFMLGVNLLALCILEIIMVGDFQWKVVSLLQSDCP
jgi:hypothetical protein